MYQYDYIDQKLIDERVIQFADQVARRLNDSLSEDEFRPLRLQNGLYSQRHAYMLRIAIPYGILSSQQLFTLSEIADRYDRGWGHFTTRQNIQFNWLKLEDAPGILADLAKVQLHAIQTSGNCVRNITSDALAGVAVDEIVDPRPYAEWLRQWSTLHPEFSYLPRKFKIAINGALEDRSALKLHDIGINLKLNQENQVIVDLWVGGGMGRTPFLASLIFANLSWEEVPDHIRAILRVYNLYGRRDNIYKARIKILVQALGVEAFTNEVSECYQKIKNSKYATNFKQNDWLRICANFSNYQSLSLNNEFKQNKIASSEQIFNLLVGENEKNKLAENERLEFQRFYQRNVIAQKQAGYFSVVISLKPHLGLAPGDMTSEQMRQVSNLAKQYSNGEIRIAHEQNLVLINIHYQQIFELWQQLKIAKLAEANRGLATDIITCPGGDFCSLANARSIPLAKAIQKMLDNYDYLFELGEISINISGCINSCGHHHIANIGILGVDKNDQEFYQITIGGEEGLDAKIGKVIGPSIAAEQVPNLIKKILDYYLVNRQSFDEIVESFPNFASRTPISSFKEILYA